MSDYNSTDRCKDCGGECDKNCGCNKGANTACKGSSNGCPGHRCLSSGEPRGKLHCTDWLSDIPGGFAESEFVEVQFKNTRKGYYRNSLKLPLIIGDMVVVEAQTGYDIGIVTLTGALVDVRIRRLSSKAHEEIRRISRTPKPADIDKYEEAKAREHDTMIRARRIAEDLNLNMKIGDVEYQGDGAKAIFYYIADERVDFRQLIKVLAETFKVRIEMKQIGARQEAGRIGGIGPCGRPLCCASWMSNFVSVATSAARYQDLSLNPQKLAGQCAKLKCCLNFEVDAYVEGIKRLPPKDTRLETADATYFHFKTDIFKREITYSTDKSIAANLVTIDADRAFEIIAMNKAGEKPVSLIREGEEKPREKAAYGDLLDQDDLTRFDKKKRKKNKKKRDAAPVDTPANERPAKDTDKKSHQLKPGAPKDRPAKDNSSKSRQGKEKTPKERPSKENTPKEQGPKDAPARDNRPKSKPKPKTFKPRPKADGSENHSEQ